MSESKYIIGIDLGTTHCVMAYAEGAVDADQEPIIQTFMIPQVVNPGDVRPQPLLPSFLFLPGPHDVPPGSLALPWDPSVDYTIGELGRKRGTEVPNRLVASAKSWLSYAGVDRTEPILPWDSPAEGRKVSPLEASSLFLAHLRDAWNHSMAEQGIDALFESQEIYLTVPASFDVVARELTVKAAQAAGLEHITLLEEPQAAFYAWIESQRERWRKAVRVDESILVCDIGGGTTDFSLIQVSEEQGELTLRRVAVGNHILLGGDNMDLTLAYALQAKLAQTGVRLDSWQFRGLWHSCRTAKERLLSNPGLQSEPIVILGRGTSLIGGTIRSELTRAEVEQVLVEGFFPVTDRDEYPQSRRKVGVREMGLPYESDPAVSRHLARFLGQSERGLTEAGSNMGYPSAVLFNGGVMKSDLLRRRFLDILRRWHPQEYVRELSSADLDLAVARGAAYYGLARRGRGIRIRGGVARPYYIGIESAMPAVPGIPTPIKALCIVPFGMEEGTGAEIREREFGLVVGEPAAFNLLASTVRKKDQVGEIIDDWQGEIDEVTTMEAVLPASEAVEGASVIPVWLQSKVTEIGTLELWCVARDDDQKRWKLEFNLREQQDVA